MLVCALIPLKKKSCVSFDEERYGCPVDLWKN